MMDFINMIWYNNGGDFMGKTRSELREIASKVLYEIYILYKII